MVQNSEPVIPNAITSIKEDTKTLKIYWRKINSYLNELDSNDQDEADIHVPSAEEIQSA